MLKGLPLAYGKDLQEDKEPVFDAADSLALCLAAMTAMISGMTSIGPPGRRRRGRLHHRDRSRRLAGPTPMLFFREAHRIASQAVRRAEQRGIGLAELDSRICGRSPRITAEVFEVLSVERSVASRTSFGGTARARARGDPGRQGALSVRCVMRVLSFATLVLLAAAPWRPGSSG